MQNRITSAAIIAEAPAMSLAQIASKINTEHHAVEQTARASLAHARAAGELLAAAKAQVGHGRWLGWLGEHCRVSARMAQRYMRVAERWTELISKNDTVTHLTLRDGLRLLAEADAPAYCSPPNSSGIVLDGRAWVGVTTRDGSECIAELWPSKQHPGYYHCSFLRLENDHIDGTTRPIIASHAVMCMRHILEQRGGPAFEEFAWQEAPLDGISLADVEQETV
jgi:hypothetical protein